jgi:hypothetical protein
MRKINDRMVSEFVQLLTSPCDFDARPGVMKRLVSHPAEAEAAFVRLEQTLQELRSAIRLAAAND